MQGRIQSPFENLRWTFLQKQLMTFSHQLFLQKLHLYVWILITSLVSSVFQERKGLQLC